MTIREDKKRTPALAVFSVRSYRFQWPADLLISCAIEMEVPILGWFILVKTNSVVMLAVFGSLHYIGTLLSPLLGVAGDRLGCRNLLFLLRAFFTFLAVLILALGMIDWLDPILALIIAGLGGLFRPSDGMVRNTLIAQSVPENLLMSAVGISRITQDIARILGALTGTGLVTYAGFPKAYEVIVLLYILGTFLTLGALQVKSYSTPRSPLQDMWHGLTYVWNVPALLSAFWIAFLFNLTAYPFTLGLLPYVAKNIYNIDQTGLGLLVASFSCGGLLGSISLSIWGHLIQAGRIMIIGCAVWYFFLLLFGQSDTLLIGLILLCCAGYAQNICSVPMFVIMLKISEEAYRGRVMGIRMLAIYGLPMGLIIAGAMIDHIGFSLTNLIFVLTGLILLASISLIWRKDLLDTAAIANQK
jgi:predicted MFS family arabinose efflux permease